MGRSFIRLSPFFRKVARQRRRVAAIAAIAGVASFLEVSAAINQWTNGDGTGSWADALNWSQSHSPINADQLLFTSAGAGASLALDASFSLQNLSFDTANAITIDANSSSENLRSLSLGAGVNALGGTAVVALSSATAATVTLGQASGHGTLKLAFLGPASFDVPNAAANLVLGAQTSSFTSNGLTKTGAGTLTVNGDLSVGNVFTESAGTIVLNSPTRISGLTRINGGTLVVANPNALQFSVVTPAAGLQFAAGLGTATFAGLSGSANVVLQDTAGAPLTLQIEPGLPTGIGYTGILSGSGGLMRVESHDPLLFSSFNSLFILGRANTYTGATTLSGTVAPPSSLSAPLSDVRSSALVLDFTAAGAPASNIISASSPLVFGGSTLGSGGTLVLQSSSTHSQSFASTTVREGASFLIFHALAGTFTGALGALTREGGTLNVTLPATGSVSASAPLSQGILGAWATTGSDPGFSGASYGAPFGWATISGGKLVAYTGYTSLSSSTIPSNPAANYNVQFTPLHTAYGAGGTTTDLNTIRIVATIASTIYGSADQGVLRFGAMGGILYPSSNNALIVGSAVGNGSVTAGGADNAPGELFLVVGATGIPADLGGINMNSTIVNNGAGVVSLSKSGAGIVTLNSPNNTFGGGTVVEEGGIEAGSAVGAFGRNGSGPAGGDVTVKSGGQVHLTGGTWDNRFFISGTGSVTLRADGALWLSGATLTGDIRLVTNAQIGTTGAVASVVSGVVSGNAALLSSGSSTEAPTIFTNAANSFTGGIGISGGTIAFTSVGAMGNDTRRNILMRAGALALTFPGVQAVLNQRLAPDVSGTIALGADNANDDIDFGQAGLNTAAVYLGGVGTVNYTGHYTPSGGVYRLGGGGGTFNYARDIAGASSVVLGGSGGTTMLTGRNSYSGSTYFLSGTVAFHDLGEFGTGPLSLGAATLLFLPGNTSDLSVRPTKIFDSSSLDLGANNVSFANSIGGGGSGKLTKLGTGTLTLNAANDYSGSTTVSAGSLIANVTGALPIQSQVVLNTFLNSGVSLVLGADQSIANFDSTDPFQASGARVLLNGHRLTFGSDNQGTSGSDAEEIYAAIIGTGQLVKVGNGYTKIYNGLSSAGQTTDYSGTLAINGGTLALNFTNLFFASPANDLLPAGNPVSLGGGTLGVVNQTSAAVSQTFAQATINPGANAFAVAGSTSGTVALVLNKLSRTVAGGTVNFSASAGSGVMTKAANAGGTILGGWATYGGSQFAVSAGDGSTAGAITGLATGEGSFAAGGNVDAAASNVASVPISSLRFNGISSAAVNAAGGLTINTGGILLAGASGATISGGSVTSGNGMDLIVIADSTSGLTIGSKITGAIGLTKSGAGSLAVANGGNDFTGPVTIDGGVLQVLASGALGNNPVSLNGNGGATTQLSLADGVVLSNAISLSGPNAVFTQGTIVAAGPATLNGPVAIVSDAQQAGGGTFSGPLTLNGPITAPAGFTLSSQAGAVVFAGGGNYTNYVIRADTNTLGADNGMSTAAVLDLATTAVAALELNGHNQTLAGLGKSTYTGTIMNSATTPATLTLDVPAGRTPTSSIALAGNLLLVKTGAGSQTFSGAQTFAVLITVNGGILAIDGAFASSRVMVNAGGTLEGTGIVGALTVNGGGTLAPGSGLGTLFAGDWRLAAGAHFDLDINTPAGSDQLKVTGTVSLAGDVRLTLFPNFAERIGDKFFVVLNDGTELVDGAFSNASDGTLSDAAGHRFAVNYADNGDAGAVGNDISLTVIAVPEPGAAALFGGVSLLAGLGRLRRRR